IVALLFIFIFSYVTIFELFCRVEIEIGVKNKVFIGVGKIGRTQYFKWSEIESMHMSIARNTAYQYRDIIILEGTKRVKFGHGLNRERTFFLFVVLKYLFQQYNNSTISSNEDQIY
ncbi:MAG: hypothetical protein PF588_08655, partial [Candidatus Kapabacteria bacterium]|nr:hypothetical protein [Candidatus Kapabacteria bacterium]